MKKIIINSFMALMLLTTVHMNHAMFSDEYCAAKRQEKLQALAEYEKAVAEGKSAEEIARLSAKYRVLKQQWSDDIKDYCPFSL